MRAGRPAAAAWAAAVLGATVAVAAPTTVRPTTQPADAPPETVPPAAARRPPPVLPPPLPPPASQPAKPAAASRPPATAAVPPPPPASQPVALPSTPAVPIPDAVAYWAGLATGRRLRERLGEDGRAYDNLLVLKGVIDGLADREAAFPRADVQAAADQLQANVLQRRAERRCADSPAYRRLADDNAQHSRDLLAENAKLVGVRARPDGVQVRVLHEGTGRPVGPAAKAVSARLSVSLADGTLVAGADPAGPAKVVLSDVLPALSDAVREMRAGDRWRIVLPADKAYGLAGNPPLVGPNQALAYDVEVVDAD